MPHTLKPCPFCGSDSIVEGYIRDGRQVFCSGCHAAGGPAYHGPNGSALERAIANWNRRVEP